jgi:hypothetical protein
MRILLPVLLVLTAGMVSAQTEQADTSSQPAITTRHPGPPTSGAEIYGLIENTGPEEGLSVLIRLERNSDMGTIRDLVQRLEIQRVLASMSPDGRNPPIGMGIFYDQERAWNYGVCRILSRMAFEGLPDGSNMQPNKWPVFELRAYGSADKIRALIADPVLPPLTITEASVQPRRVEQRFAEAVRRESDQLILLPVGFKAPDYCAQFRGLVDAPILAGNPVNTRIDSNLTPDELLRQQLLERANNVPVTLQFDLDQPSKVDALARLVQQYQIDGFVAELYPTGNDRVLIEAPLSIYGPNLALQAQKINCGVALAARQHATGDSPWTANRARASLTVANAWSLISDPAVRNPRLIGEFRPADIESLMIWHNDHGQRPMEFSSGTVVPAACEAFTGIN